MLKFSLIVWKKFFEIIFSKIIKNFSKNRLKEYGRKQKQNKQKKIFTKKCILKYSIKKKLLKQKYRIDQSNITTMETIKKITGLFYMYKYKNLKRN
jgi:hypothetical protein